MSICIDARMISHSGIGSYIEGLLNVINLNQNLPCQITALGDPALFKEKNITKIPIIPEFSPIYSITEQWKLKTKSKKFKIFHSPHYNIPLLYSGRLIVTIHDLIHLKFPQYLPSKRAFLYAKYMLKKAVSRSVKIIANSNFTKNDIIDYFSVNPDKIEVIHLGINPGFKKINDEKLLADIKKKNNIKNRFILNISAKRPHKNIEKLILAFNQIIQDPEYHDLHFVQIGPDYKIYPKIKTLIKDLNLRGHVTLISDVSLDDLILYYNAADVFVFPSLYEGFGIPPLEAMACGTPVIASNQASIPEVLDNAAMYVDPTNTDQLDQEIKNVLTNSELRNDLINKGFERISKFSINKMVLDTLAIYAKFV